MREVIDVFAALSDATRLAILLLVSRHGELCVCEIQDILSLSPSRASRQLKELRLAGLLEDRRAGAWAYYRVPARPGRSQAVLLGALAEIASPAALANVDDLFARYRARRSEADCPRPLQGDTRKGELT